MTNKKYRTKKLLLLVFPFSFLSVLVLVLLLLLLFSHLLPISLSLSLSLTYLSASHKAATKASDIANNHGAVLLGHRPPVQVYTSVDCRFLLAVVVASLVTFGI